MKRAFLDACIDAIHALNANYGRGHVVFVGITLAGEGWFLYTIPFSHHCSGRPRRRSFRIYHRHGSDRVTVYAIGHQLTVKI